jgi:peptide/nickel transport system substrate-binding protein
MQILSSIRYSLKLLGAFLLRFKGLILISAVIGVVGFLFSSFILPKIVSSHTSRIGITGRFAPDGLPNEILEDVSDGLTKISPERVVEPSLASHWETPDKGKTWVFYLKPGIKWQDGTAIKSTDFNYQFSDVEIEKPNNDTIVFKLKDPFSPFPSVLSRPVFKSGFLGTGEWKVGNISLAGTYVQSISLAKKGEETRIYKFFPTEERTKLAFMLGQVDMISEIIEPSPLDKWDTVEVKKEVKMNQIVTLFYNNDQGPFSGTESKSLRQALDYAINKEAFGGARAISPINPSSWVYNPQVKPYNYDKDRAKELLGDRSKEPLQIKLVASPSLLSVAESIAKDWEAVGVKAIIQVSSVIPTDFEVYLAILDVPKDPDQYAIWHSTQKDSTNISKFTNHRIDKLLEDGRVELNQEERRNIYLDFQRFLVEEVPAAFLYHPVTYTIIRK